MQIVDSMMDGQKATAIAGLEIYQHRSSLSRQASHSEFKRYHNTATAEDLYGRREAMNAWYLTAGFVALGETAATAQGIVVTVLMQVRDRNRMVELLR